MALREELVSGGNWLFRWRGYLPLVVLFPLFLIISVDSPPRWDERWQIVWQLGCFAVSLLGLLLRVLTVGFQPAGTSGRNTRQQVAESLNTTGVYSLVRHPLYLGNFLMWTGVVLFCGDWELLVIFVLGFWLYYERIMMAEEEFLRRKFGQVYEDWAAGRPAFVPSRANWTPPALTFCWRTVLRREYSGVFALVVVFTGMDLLKHVAAEGRPEVEPFWLLLGGLSLLAYVALRTTKKWSRLLHVEGR